MRCSSDGPQQIIATSGSTRRGPCTAPTRSCGASSRSVEDPYLRERETDVADVAGRLRMNLRHGARRPARPAEGARRALDPDRRRAHRVARGAARLDPHPGVRRRRRQPHLSHRHPRALAERARPSSACTTRRRACRRARRSSSTARPARWSSAPAGRSSRRRSGARARPRRRHSARRTSAAEPLTHRRRRAASGSTPTSSSRGPAVPRRVRRRGRRALSLGVHAVGALARRRDRGAAIRGLPQPARAGGAAAR